MGSVIGRDTTDIESHMPLLKWDKCFLLQTSRVIEFHEDYYTRRGEEGKRENYLSFSVSL